MRGLGGGRGAGVRRAVCLGLVGVLVVGAVSCGDDDTEAGSSEPDDSTGSATTASADLLGESNPASGEPVKVGLITDGGECADCSSTAGDEEPVAKATVEWANEYLGGLAGRPIELVVCVDDLDPAKATDCANQMISDGVAAVVIGASGVIEQSWTVLHAAGVPVVNYSATQPALLEDDASTFVLQDSEALTVNFPLALAEDIDADTVSIIVVDLPIATDAYGGDTPDRYDDAGIELDVVPVPLGTPDMTPQAQQLVTTNPDGLVFIVGHDQFCIPAINALNAVGFTGTIATIANCVTDAMREAMAGDVLEGLVLSSSIPVGDDEDSSLQQYYAVLDEYGVTDVDRSGATPIQVFASVASLSLATQGMTEEVTPESLITAYGAMPNEVLPASGGRHFRCNGDASPHAPAVCTASSLSTTLDAEGLPTTYEVHNDVDTEG